MMPRFRSYDPWRIFWQFVTSRYTLGAVLLILAVALLFAVSLPQTSGGGSASDAVWQAQIQRRFGGTGWFSLVRSPLQAIGAFRVTDAVWFRLLLALLSLCLFARLVDGVEALWQRRRDNAPPEDVAWETVQGDWDELLERLRGRRLRVVAEGQAGAGEASTETLVHADRWPLGEMGPILVYLSGLVVLLGASFTALWGWQTEPLLVTAGERVALGRDSGLVLQLDELSDDGQQGSGRLWREDGTLVSTGELAGGRPLAGDGVGAYLVHAWAGLQIQATLSDTQVLKLATRPDQDGADELALTFTDDETRVQVGILGTDKVLVLEMPRPVRVGSLPGVQVIRSGSAEIVLEQAAPADTVLRIDGISVFLKPIPSAEIRAVRDPGAFWVQLGVVCLLIGAAIWGRWPSRRLWLRRQSDGVEAVGDVRLLPTLELAPAPAGNDEE